MERKNYAFFTYLLTLKINKLERLAYVAITTLIKKNQIFLITQFRMEQLQSHIWRTASLNMVKYLRISSYIRKPFLIYDLATAPFWISLYTRKMLFSFLSVLIRQNFVSIFLNKTFHVSSEILCSAILNKFLTANYNALLPFVTSMYKLNESSADNYIYFYKLTIQ